MLNIQDDEPSVLMRHAPYRYLVRTVASRTMSGSVRLLFLTSDPVRAQGPDMKDPESLQFEVLFTCFIWGLPTFCVFSVNCLLVLLLFPLQSILRSGLGSHLHSICSSAQVLQLSDQPSASLCSCFRCSQTVCRVLVLLPRLGFSWVLLVSTGSFSLLKLRFYLGFCRPAAWNPCSHRNQIISVGDISHELPSRLDVLSLTWADFTEHAWFLKRVHFLQSFYLFHVGPNWSKPHKLLDSMQPLQNTHKKYCF